MFVVAYKCAQACVIVLFGLFICVITRVNVWSFSRPIQVKVSASLVRRNVMTVKRLAVLKEVNLRLGI